MQHLEQHALLITATARLLTAFISHRFIEIDLLSTHCIRKVINYSVIPTYKPRHFVVRNKTKIRA